MNKLPIESIKITRHAAKGGFNGQQPEETSFLFLEQFFDTSFNKIKEIVLSEEGDEEQIVEFEYNSDGKLIAETHHFLFDEIDEKTIFTYQDGLIAEKKKEFSYGSIETTVWKYNEDKLPVSILVLDEDGREEESEHFEYSGKNIVHYVKQNALIGKDVEVWLTYDDKNRVVEEKRWSHADMRTLISTFDYTKSEEDPDSKVYNDKGAVIEAHIKKFNEKNLLVKQEIQQANYGLKTFVTTYEYNESDKITFLETINQSGKTERSVSSTYDDNGLLLSEIKSEFEVATGTINTFTLNYAYTFHQK